MRHRMRTRGGSLTAVIVVAALLLAACGDDAAPPPAAEEPEPEPAEEPDEPEDTDEPDDVRALPDLSVCGERIVLQSDWFPQAVHGKLYQLAGVEGEFDSDVGAYTNQHPDGPIIEVRAGGPFIGFQGGVATLYQDPDVTASYVAQDEAVRVSGRQPVTLIVSAINVTPQILMWDPEVWQFDSFEDIGESGATVLHFAGAFYVDYLVGSGLLNQEQLDSSYDGSPARFIAEGNLVQQGFVTSEPYSYEHEFEQFGKPVDYLMIHDSGFEIYPNSSLAVRKDDVEEKADCLAALVPWIQQSQIDFLEDPEPVIQLLVDIAETLPGWTLTEGKARYEVQTMIDLGLVRNEHDNTLGNFDMSRVQRINDILGEIYAAQNVDSWDPDVTAEDIATNRFIDPDIGL
jgi:hypothetical protein